MDNLPKTEEKLEASCKLHEMSIKETTTLMIEEEYNVIIALKNCQTHIDQVIAKTINCFQNNGRLFYVGAGTSGRLGVLDASECPPTFSAPSEMVQGIIAGGDEALKIAIEGAEDSEEQGCLAIQKNAITAQDIVVGIAASGRTPFVHGALKEASRLKAKTALITCMDLSNPPEYINDIISAVVGPEILSGSTRLKAGTVTKLILNMITTTAMAQIGKVYQNLMVDLRPTNAKLRKRAVRIVQEITQNKNKSDVHETLLKANWEVKTTIVMILKSIDYDEAKKLLRIHGDLLGKIIG